MQGAWVCCEKIAETGGAARERERDACAETTESTYIFFKEANFLIYYLYKYQTTILYIYIYIPYLTTSTSVWPSSELVDQSNMLPQLLDPKKWHWGRQEPLARAPAVPSEKVFGVGARSNQSLLRRYDWSPTVGIGALLVAPSSLGVALEQTDGPYCGCGPLVTLQTIPCTLRPVVLTCLDRLSPLNPSGFGGSVMLLHGVCVFLLHFQMCFFRSVHQIRRVVTKTLESTFLSFRTGRSLVRSRCFARCVSSPLGPVGLSVADPSAPILQAHDLGLPPFCSLAAW